MAATLALRLSGGAANADPAASLGGILSATAVPTALTANSIFDDVSGTEEQAGDTEYRGLYIVNTGDVDAENVTVWLTDTSDADTTIAVALADEGVNATMETIANENTAPAGPAFSMPTSEGAGLDMGTIAAGQRYGLWIRRTVAADAGASADQFTISASFDTAP
jgi:hypothetical protein